MAKKKNKNDNCDDGIVLAHPYCNWCRRITSPFSLGYMEKQNLNKSVGLSGIIMLNSRNHHPEWVCIFCFGGYNFERYSIKKQRSYSDIVRYFENIYNNPNFPRVTCYTCKNYLAFSEGIWCQYNEKKVCVCDSNCIASFVTNKEVTNCHQKLPSEDESEKEKEEEDANEDEEKEEEDANKDEEKEPKEAKDKEEEIEIISSLIEQNKQLKLEVKHFQKAQTKLLKQNKTLIKTILKLTLNVPQNKSGNNIVQSESDNSDSMEKKNKVDLENDVSQKAKRRIRKAESDTNSKQKNTSGNESDTDSVDSFSTSISSVSG